MKSISKVALCLIASSVVLTACGSGSSSDNDLVNSSFVQDPVTPDPVTPDPVTPDPVTPDPVTPDPITPDPDPGIPVGLSDMFGRVLLTHRFEPNGDTTYIYDVEFSEADIVTADSGNQLLTGFADQFFQPDGSDDFTSGTGAPISCGATSAEVLCGTSFESGSRELFLFPFLDDGSAFGIYEFCSADVTDCLDDLLNTPDGIVLVVNTSTAPTTAGQPRAMADMQVADYSSTDALNYKLYENQASASLNPTSRSSIRPDADLEALGARIDKILLD